MQGESNRILHKKLKYICNVCTYFKNFLCIILLDHHECILSSHVLLVVLHDLPLQLVVLLRNELVGREVRVVGVILDDVVSAFG